MTTHHLLVDGSNLLFQMFYGMPARITGANGRPIQGTLGFVGALRRIIGLVRPTHAIVLFDGEHENRRTALDPNYKANRPDYTDIPDDELPFGQLPDVRAALDLLGIAHTETIDCETDDLIAAYAAACPGRVTIVSFDSDYFQLISDRVSVLRYRGDRTTIWTSETVYARFGVEPDRFAEFKALVGDSADNIRGADKVGPKTAATLLTRFGSLEDILTHIAEIERPTIRASLEASADRLRRNLALIRLGEPLDLPFPPAALTYADRAMTTTEVLRAIGVK